MRYFGGKKRIANELSNFLNNYTKYVDFYLEPFVGSAVIIEKITDKVQKVASDKNEYLIEMFKSIQQGWEPPTKVTEEFYKYIQNNKDYNKALTGFVGIGLSYTGKWFGGYCRDNTDRNYALNAYNTLLKQKSYLSDVTFLSADYKDFKPKDCLIYCDPPYHNTTSYDYTGKFDTAEFWEVMRCWTKDNLVFVSEYKAPEDFKCVLEIKTKTDIRNKNGNREDRIERLFTLNNL